MSPRRLPGSFRSFSSRISNGRSRTTADKLGFTLDFIYDDFYASVSRDGCKIHLKHGPRLAGEKEFRKEHDHLDAHVGVTGVRELFGEMQKRGADVVKPLEKRPWDCIDFYVEDADGYLLCFSELIA